MIEHLPQPSPAELDALTALWEASVRATHDFLSEEDIPFFRQMVRNEALPGTTLYVIRESEAGTNRSGDACGSGGAYAGAEKTGGCRRKSGGAGKFGGFTAFAGVAGDMLEMLFVAPQARGKGVGRQLVEYLVRERGIRQVDVNEQNTQAAGFYARLGFRVTGRDATDPSGRPYPILHLSLGETPQRIVPIPNLQTDRVAVDFEPEPTGDEGK